MNIILVVIFAVSFTAVTANGKGANAIQYMVLSDTPKNIHITGACALSALDNYAQFIALVWSHYISLKRHDNLKCNRFLADAVIRQLFELLRQLIKDGSIDNNVPVLDPLQIQHQEIHLQNDRFTIQLELSNFTTFGLGDFVLLDTTFDKEEISLELNMIFPLLTILSENYKMRGNVYGIFPLFGNGLLDVEAHNFKFRSKVYLRQSDDGKSILIGKILRSRIEVDKIVSRSEFDGNIDHIMNAMIGDLLADYLSRFGSYIVAQHQEYAIQFLNQYFIHFESWRLIAVIL